MHRKPVVSGIFYQGNIMTLRTQIEGLFLNPKGPGVLPGISDKSLIKSYGLILPHASYVYSGPVAAWGINEAAQRGKPETIVLLGPSHTGLGMPVSVWDTGQWETPFGLVDVDSELAKKFLSLYDYAKPNYDAHLNEHSLEIQIPLFQFIFGRTFKILPITMMDQRKKTAIEIAKVFEKMKDDKPILFVASSDLNHYESQEETEKKDLDAIENILSSDVENLYKVISEKEISICGFGPISTLLKAGLGKPQLLKHLTSGEISGDYSHVVGYASFVIE